MFCVPAPSVAYVEPCVREGARHDQESSEKLCT